MPAIRPTIDPNSLILWKHVPLFLLTVRIFGPRPFFGGRNCSPTSNMFSIGNPRKVCKAFACEIPCKLVRSSYVKEKSIPMLPCTGIQVFHHLIIMLLFLRSTFYEILREVEDHPQITRDCWRHDFLRPEEQLAIALRFLATGDSYESVGCMSGASRASVHNCVVGVCAAIFKKGSKWLHPPRSFDECLESVSVLERMGNWSSRSRGGVRTPGIPQAVAAMHGTQVLLGRKPAHSGDAYVNRKGHKAMNVNAVCDAHLRFIDVYAGRAGRNHDAAVWSHSPMCQALLDPTSDLAQLFDSVAIFIDDARVPLQVLTDSAYPARQFLLPAYKKGAARADQARGKFNDKHTTTRNVIERAFGVLKSKWRCLYWGLDLSIETVCFVIIACFVLHNPCLLQRDPLPSEDEEYQEMKRWYEERMDIGLDGADEEQQFNMFYSTRSRNERCTSHSMGGAQAVLGCSFRQSPVSLQCQGPESPARLQLASPLCQNPEIPEHQGPESSQGCMPEKVVKEAAAASSPWHALVSLLTPHLLPGFHPAVVAGALVDQDARWVGCQLEGDAAGAQCLFQVTLTCRQAQTAVAPPGWKPLLEREALLATHPLPLSLAAASPLTLWPFVPPSSMRKCKFSH
eukprot:1147602-Pelagomonas_calceolata.AAC.2